MRMDNAWPAATGRAVGAAVEGSSNHLTRACSLYPPLFSPVQYCRGPGRGDLIHHLNHTPPPWIGRLLPARAVRAGTVVKAVFA